MADAAVAPRRTTSLDGLVEALDRVIDGGAAVSGDIVIAVAGVDLIRVDLRLLVAAVAEVEA